MIGGGFRFLAAGCVGDLNQLDELAESEGDVNDMPEVSKLMPPSSTLVVRVRKGDVNGELFFAVPFSSGVGGG
jgi:hypothetical protein